MGVDDTIVEKIVPLLPEEEEENEDLSKFSTQEPTIQLHDPQAPDISRYFLVFRQGCNDYARLCVEKKNNSYQKGGTKDSMSTGPSPNLSTASSLSISDSPVILPLDSENPISATATVLSTSVSALDLHEEMNNQDAFGRASISPTPVAPPQPGANGYYSFRIYQTYASFYHTLASGVEGTIPRVQTQRQTSEIEGSSAEINLKDTKSKSRNSHSNTNTSTNLGPSTNNPALDAAAMWKRVKTQSHTFKGHLLPSPEIPCDLDAPAGTKYVIFVVHGVGQRAFRKMGFHFNKDCDEMRNVLLDAAQTRGLPPGSVVVLPVSWRAELNLAGNFTFGDSEEDDEIANEALNNPGTTEAIDSPKIDKDLKELSESFNSNLDAASKTFQRAVSVFEGQFTEILERMALESIPAVRSVLSDATMDILLYVSQKHFKKILGAVIKEVLRLQSLFAHWNPDYTGNFSFVAHSLGSALVADLLSYTVHPDEFINNLNAANEKENGNADVMNVFLDSAQGNIFPFKIDKFFAFGSPLGVFHLLKHTKPIGCIHSPHIVTAFEERSRKWQAARRRPGGEKVKDVPAWSVYNCRLFYNVFHPHDPVAHRFESLTLPHLKIENLGLGTNNTNSNSKNKNNTSNTSNKSPLPPPLKIPYHKSGLTRFKMDLEAKIARAKDDWLKMTSKLPKWLGGNKDEAKEVDSADSDARDLQSINEESSSNQDQFNVRDENPLAAFNHHFRRVDFSLHDSVMENAYISALGAHFIYWSDLDIAAFIVSELIKN